jgi:hypothetical protein
METHAPHLHKTPGKKWSQYLFEFFMLFLAVFCGFLAENKREHIVEHQRAKEYAHQMINDLRQDTSFLTELVQYVQEHNQAFDTVNSLFDKAPPVSNATLLRAVLTQRTTYPTQLSATTFNQMKSSGSIRYFQNSELSREISNYYDQEHFFLNVAITYANNFFTTDVQPFMLDHFDYSESDYFTDTLKTNNPVYLHRSAETDILLRNRLILYNSLLRWNIDHPVRRVYKRAIGLIESLKKEYDLK